MLQIRLKQKGSAIIIALFFVSLVAMLAVIMFTRLQGEIYRTTLIKNSLTMELYAAGSIAWAKEQLNENWQHKKPNQVVDVLPIQSPEDTIDHITIESRIESAEGFFNLNNLANPNFSEDFNRLMRTVMPTLSPDTAKEIIIAIRDWLTPTTQNELETYYSKQKPAYRAPHRLMSNASELRLIKGIDAEIFNALKSYIIALPAETKVDINQADIPVLVSLSPTLTKASAATLKQIQKSAPFPTVNRFLENDIVKNNPIPDNKITTISSYFLITTTVKIAEQKTIFYTLMQRIVKNEKPVTMILWQTQGTL